MTCADVRHRILTADLSALSGESDASLREHLAGCSTCAAEASRIIDGTARLRIALVARQRRPEIRRARERRIAMSLIPVALAAELALIAVLTHRDRPLDLQRPVLDDSVVTTAAVTPVADTDASFGAGSKPVARRPIDPALSPVDSEKRRDGTARAGVIGRLADADPAMSQVRVTVGDRQRAAVIATSNPNVTLVWLSRGDSL